MTEYSCLMDVFKMLLLKKKIISMIKMIRNSILFFCLNLKLLEILQGDCWTYIHLFDLLYVYILKEIMTLQCLHRIRT